MSGCFATEHGAAGAQLDQFSDDAFVTGAECELRGNLERIAAILRGVAAALGGQRTVKHADVEVHGRAAGTMHCCLEQGQRVIVVGSVPLADIARVFGVVTGHDERLVDARREFMSLFEIVEGGVVMLLFTSRQRQVLPDRGQLHQREYFAAGIVDAASVRQRHFGFARRGVIVGSGVVGDGAHTGGRGEVRVVEMFAVSKDMFGVLPVGFSAGPRLGAEPVGCAVALVARELDVAAQLQQLCAQVNIFWRAHQQGFESGEGCGGFVEEPQLRLCLSEAQHSVGQQVWHFAAGIHGLLIVLYRCGIVAAHDFDRPQRHVAGSDMVVWRERVGGDIHRSLGVGSGPVEIAAALVNSAAGDVHTPAVVIIAGRVIAEFELLIEQRQHLVQVLECGIGVARVEGEPLAELVDADRRVIARNRVGALLCGTGRLVEVHSPTGIASEQLLGCDQQRVAHPDGGGIKFEHACQCGRAKRNLAGLGYWAIGEAAQIWRRTRMDRCARSVAINLAWRELDINAPAFTNREGRVLARALKCLLDPLVLQPRINTEIGAAVLDAKQMVRLKELLAAAQPRLEVASKWYDLLRAQRRALGITAGNAQELYFPRAYELATTLGAPGDDAIEHCREMLSEVHAIGGDAEQLRAAFNDPETLADLTAELQQHWDAAVGRSAPLTTDEIAELADAARDALSDRKRSRDTRRGWARLRDGGATALGEALRVQCDVAENFARAAESETAPDALAQTLPLTAPALADARTETTALDQTGAPEHPGAPEQPGTPDRHGALDRPIEVRTRAAIRRLRTAGFSADIELLDDEIARSCQAFGMRDADLAAAFVAGMLVAGWVHPLAAATHPGAPQALHPVISRARNEAYVLYLRRALHAGHAVHPEQEPVVADLRDFSRHYLRRLWTRLHGRDVLRLGLDVEGEAFELLAGVVRSTLHDQRQRMRRALEQFGGWDDDEERNDATIAA